MNINNIPSSNPINPIHSVEKTSKVNSKDEKSISKSIDDQVSIAAENKKVADLLNIKQIVLENDHVRADKIEQAKIRLENYFKDGKLDSNLVDKMAKNISVILK